MFVARVQKNILDTILASNLLYENVVIFQEAVG